MTGTALVNDLAGKVVVVTGAARGQGRAEAEAVAAVGGRAIACDLSWSQEDRAQLPPGIEPYELDVTDAAGWAELATSLGQRGLTVHGLVNNAGASLRARLGEIEVEDWNRILAVNVTGAMLGIQTLLPLMTNGGSIVNVGSLAAVTAHPAAAYTASKWAIRGLSRVASMQLGERGIRSNLINPGFIETPMTDAAPETFRSANIRNTPAGRVGTVDDVAPLVLFLLSDASSFITGAEIPIDGGQAGHGGAKAIFDLDRAAGTTGTLAPVVAQPA